MAKVFISYSHKDENWVRNWLVPRLEHAGIKTHVDWRDFEIGVPSDINMERAVETCEKTILVMTPAWVESQAAQLEAIMLQSQDRAGLKKKIMPLMLKDCRLPLRLRILTYADFRDEAERQSQIARVIAQIKKDFAELAPAKRQPPSLDRKYVDITSLPQTGYLLFGRTEQLKLLDESWESGAPNVLAFVAFGGVGKSTLVNKWLEKMRWDNYRGAERVFAWSFYSQGTNERVASADRFISDALAWFGDKDPARGSPWDKGRRLADLVRSQKTLLILDGLEPLQSPFHFEKGAIKDPALAMLITGLARHNDGLCVITTREKVPELDRFAETASQKNLEHISKEAARALLRVEGVRGTDRELEAAGEAFANHALAVQLLAAYLHGISGHHVSNAKEIPLLKRIPEDKGRHPRRVMAAFDKRFADGPESQLLRIMGLFARPAEIEAIDAVRAAPPIPGLTDKLRDLTHAEWSNLIAELRQVELLARFSTHNPNHLDCHPLIREHFGQKLLKTNEKVWREGHSRLYEYYKAIPEKLYGKYLPNTLQEMEPLFAAVTHGCAAGRYQETLDEICKRRIDHRKAAAQIAITSLHPAYLIDTLGAVGADLEVLSNFFNQRWKTLADELTDNQKSFVLSKTGLLLGLLCRFVEATQSMRNAMDIRKSLEKWGAAAEDARHISQFFLRRGLLDSAEKLARESLELADKEVDLYYRIAARSNLADVLHQVGKLEEAKAIFAQAEAIQRERQPQSPFLFRLHGFRYLDLLLDQGEYDTVLSISKKTVEDEHQKDYLAGRGLHRLCLARSRLFKALSTGGLRPERTLSVIELAMAELRGSNQITHLPHGLFAFAEFCRHTGGFAKASVALDEAEDIAQREDGMPLYLADYHLEAARLRLAEANLEDATTHYKEAKAAVDKMGYHRRDVELLLIEAELAMLKADKPAAKRTLGQAEKKINDESWHIWDADLARLRQKLET